MGEVVGAALVSHVPNLVLPEAERRELNHGQDTSLFQGLHDLYRLKMSGLDYDTVVVFDTHWFTTIARISEPLRHISYVIRVHVFHAILVRQAV